MTTSAAPAVKVEQSRRFWSGDRSEALLTLAVALMVIAYAIGFSFLALHRHAVYETDAFDLANMEQAVWNTIHGRPLDFTNFEGLTNRLGAHVEPILLPISLIYAIW